MFRNLRTAIHLFDLGSRCIPADAFQHMLPFDGTKLHQYGTVASGCRAVSRLKLDMTSLTSPAMPIGWMNANVIVVQGIIIREKHHAPRQVPKLTEFLHAGIGSQHLESYYFPVSDAHDLSELPSEHAPDAARGVTFGHTQLSVQPGNMMTVSTSGRHLSACSLL